MTALSARGFEDLFSREIVDDYIQSPRFIRRDWLAADLHSILSVPSARLVLLVGEPGAGKSGFIAQLAADHPRWPVVFLRRDQALPVDRGGTRSFLLRVGLQLAAGRPELFASDQVRIEVEQRIGEVRERGKVVGAEIGRILASPFYQTVIDVRQQVERARGDVSGVRVGEWVVDPRRLDLDDLEHMALLEPARALLRIDPKEQIVILIDALDELFEVDAKDRLFNWLADLPAVPENVRFVVASRPATRLAVISGRQGDRCERLEIDPADKRLRNDLVTYATQLLTAPALVCGANKSREDPGKLVSALVNTADGNIGYLDAIGRAVDAPSQSRDDLSALLAQERLPAGLAGLYAFFLHRLRASVAHRSVRVEDPESGRPLLAELWPEVYCPILETLAVAPEALDPETLVALSGTLAGRTAVLDALSRMSQFLEPVGNGYRLYHATVAEFMTSPDTRASAETADLFVDQLAAHKRLSGRLEQRFEQLWEDCVDDLVEQSRRAYARRHYVTHLVAAGRWTTLFETLDRRSFGQQKLRRDPSAVMLFEDLRLACAATVRPGLELDEAVELLPALSRYRLLQHSLSTTADLHSAEAFLARALVGRADEAIQLAELISSAPQRGRSLSVVVSGLAEAQGFLPDQAVLVAERAAEAVRVIADDDQAVGEFDSLVGAWLAVFRKDDSLTETGITALLDLAGDRFSAGIGAAVLYALGAGLVAQDKAPRARGLIDELRGLVRDASEDPDTIAQNLSALAADLDLVDDARGALDSVADPLRRAMSTPRVAGALARATRHAEAASLLRQAESEWRDRPAEVILQAAPGFAQAWESLGELERARERYDWALQALDLDDWMVGSAADLIRHLKEACRHSESRRAIEALRRRAVDHLEQERHPGLFGLVAPQACIALADVDEPDVAMKLARRINPAQALAPLQAVAESYARMHRWAEAIDAVRAAEEVESLHLPFQVLVQLARSHERERYRPGGPGSQGARSYVAVEMAGAGEWTRARELLDSITGMPARDVALASFAVLRAREGAPADAADLLNSHDQFVRQHASATGRRENVLACLSLLAQGRAWEPAVELLDELDAGSRSDAMKRLAELLVEAEEFERASAVIAEMPEGDRAAVLVQWAKRRFATDSKDALEALAEARRISQQLPPKDAWGKLATVARALAELDRVTEAQKVLDEAMAAWGEVLEVSMRPNPWARLAADRVRVGQPDVAVEFVRRFPEEGLYDRVAGLVFIADALLERGDPERAISCLDETLDDLCESSHHLGDRACTGRWPIDTAALVRPSAPWIPGFSEKERRRPPCDRRPPMGSPTPDIPCRRCHS